LYLVRAASGQPSSDHRTTKPPRINAARSGLSLQSDDNRNRGEDVETTLFVFKL
jgi:hypothetical protein